MASTTNATNISTILRSVGLHKDVIGIIMDHTKFCEDCKEASFEFDSYDQRWHCYQCENDAALASWRYQEELDDDYYQQGTYGLCRGHRCCPYDCCN